MAHIIKRTPLPNPSNQKPSSATSGQDTFAAIFIIVMMLFGCGAMYNLISSVFTGQPVVGKDRWGNQIVSAPWSIMWWIGVILSSAMILYPGYLMVQLLRKE